VFSNIDLNNKLSIYFESWRPETDIIIVGSSPSLLWYKFGKYIDEYENVIRINKCFSEGLYDHTGKKIDIWATTNNERWNRFNPIDELTKEVWTRVPCTRQEFLANGTFNNFSGKCIPMRDNRKKCTLGSTTFNNFKHPGLGTGLIAINYALQRFKKITIIGHTFYLESQDGSALDFYSDKESEEHAKNRKRFFQKDEYGLSSLRYVKNWIREERIVLLNPHEYDNLRCGNNE